MAVAPTTVVLLTGSSRGIGAGIAAELSRRENVRIALVQRTEGAPPSLSNPDNHRVFCCDITDAAACERLVDDVVAWAGRLDVVVNNAGLSVDRDDWLDDATTFDDWSRAWEDTMAINYLAPSNLSFLAVRQFRRQEADRVSPALPADGAVGPRERGRIVNVSSRGAYCGDTFAPAYGASKSALNVFHNATAKVVANEGIFVFTVAPGATMTDMWRNAATPAQLERMANEHPLRRFNEVTEIASIVAYLAFDAPAAMTGNIVDANGGIYMR